MKDEKEKDRGFTVRDRRMFSEDGETKEGRPESNLKEEKGAPGETELRGRNGAQRGGGKGERQEAGPIEFSQFVLSLATSALMQMGQAAHPQTGETFEDMDAAKQTIDIIGMLGEKTKGNLSPEEEKLMESVLAELRLRFVRKK